MEINNEGRIMKVEVNLEDLINDILNSDTLEQAKIYARIIKKGIEVDYFRARFTLTPPKFKINMIRDARDILGLGLKEAKDFVEGISEIKMELEKFEKIKEKAKSWGGEVIDTTPNSIKFIKSLKGE